MAHPDDIMTTELLVMISSFTVAAGVVPLARRLAVRRSLLDIPNERSSHQLPMPRIGGVGILFGAATGLTLSLLSSSLPPEWQFWVLVAALSLGAVIGFVDDLLDLRTVMRLPLYLLVSATIAVFYGHIVVVELPGIPALDIGTTGGVVFSTLFIAWYTNLFNFMDGIDGIAGGTALVTLGALAIALFSSGSSILGFLAASGAAATAGFLLYNYPPASVFMGDGGSVFLGMTAGVLTLAAVEEGCLSLAASVMLMLPFVFDATFTLIRRVLRRERFWEAHRSHVYQQMCDLGLTHRQVTICYMVATVFFATIGLLFHRLPGIAQMIVWWSSLALLLFFSLFIVIKNQRRHPSTDIECRYSALRSDGNTPQR